MFSAFHYNANRGDKKFRQMYKSGEKKTITEDSITRSKNNRHLLLEKFRQIQSQLKEDNDEQRWDKNQEDDSSSQDTFVVPKDKYSSKDAFLSTSSDKEPSSFKDLGLPSSSRPISTTPIQTSAKSKSRGSVSAFDSNSCEGFDYSSSFKNTLGDNFTFNMENYNCSTEDIFDKSFTVDNATRERIWDFKKDDWNWKFDDDDLLLCPGCVQNYMKLKDGSLLCHNCTLQIDLSSPTISIRMIKDKLKQKLDLHKQKCKERVKYKFKDEKLFVSCKHCNEEYYIS